MAYKKLPVINDNWWQKLVINDLNTIYNFLNKIKFAEISDIDRDYFEERDGADYGNTIHFCSD